MDFQMLNRRELQALCKLNKIPANITNVAMVDALISLDIVVGIEDIMKPSESSETTESSIESPARTEIMSPRAPRTSYRTSTRQKPVREEAESVQTVTRTTRRRQIAGEVEDAKAATVPKTPAAVSTRRRVPAASARKNMETQLNESKEDEKVEKSMEEEKKCVPLTPAAAIPIIRRKVPAASTTQKVNLKDDNIYARTYSTRRSARLTEVKVAEPSPVKKESKGHEKIDSSSTQSFEEKLDEGSDGFNAVVKDSSFSVGIESTSEPLEPEKETTSTPSAPKWSNSMEVDVIPSDIQNSSELNKFENVQNTDRDMGSRETISEAVDKTDIADDIAPENENPSEDSKLEAVEKFSSHAKEMENEVLDQSATKISSVTFEQENVGTFEGIDADDEFVIANSSETLKGENVDASENMDSDEKTVVIMENVVLENNVEISNEDFEFPVLCPIEDLENEFSDEEMSKENDDESVTTDVGMKTKKENDHVKKGLKETSLRQLTKMLKNKLQITNSINTNTEEAEKTTTREALQTLSSNSLAATDAGNI